MPIHVGSLPHDFVIMEDRVVCLNHDIPEEIAMGNDNEDFIGFEETRYSQSSNISTNPNHPFGSEINPQSLDPYKYLISSFKMMTSAMECVATKEDLDAVKFYFYEKVGEMTTKFVETNPSSIDLNAESISSNVPSSKKRKTHGCEGHRRRK